MHLAIENNERLDLCKKCGGRCCKSMACEVSTEDFITRYGEITKESVATALRDGEWAIDWWEGDIRETDEDFCADLPVLNLENRVCQSYYMRVRHLGESAVCGSWGGTCKMWDRETGCQYDWEHRPTGGKVMVAGQAPICGEYRDRQPADPQVLNATNLVPAYVEPPKPKYGKALGAVDWFPYFDILDEVSGMEEFYL